MYGDIDPLGPTAGLMVGTAIAAGRQLRSQDRTIAHLDGLLDEKNAELRRERARVQEAEDKLVRAEREAAALRERVAYLEGLNAQARSHIVDTTRERDQHKLHVAFYSAQFEGAQAIFQTLLKLNPDMAGLETPDPAGRPSVIAAFVAAFDAEVVKRGHPELQGYSVPKLTIPRKPAAPLPKIKATPFPSVPAAPAPSGAV